MANLSNEIREDKEINLNTKLSVSEKFEKEILPKLE